MIHCRFYEDTESILYGYEFSGHANYAPEGEADILCAAVSILGQTTIYSCSEIFGLTPAFELDAERGIVKVNVYAGLEGPERYRDCHALIANCLIGIRLLASAHPEYIVWEICQLDPTGGPQ